MCIRLLYRIISFIGTVTFSCATHAQTPYDSFAPETSRPMLGVEAQAEMEKARQKEAEAMTHDTLLCVAMIDMQQERVLLVDVECGEVIATAPLTDDWRKWLSVDPLADKYPWISPYAYCAWNPIGNIDLDGMDWYDAGDGNIKWDDRAISQEAMEQAGIQGFYLGRNVLVGRHGRDENLNEAINGAVFELYLETYKEGAIATIMGNIIPCDVYAFGTLKEGYYPAEYKEYHGKPAILTNGGGDLPTVNGNPNNKKNYVNEDKNMPMKPIDEHIMNEIFFHYGNNYFQGLKDSSGKPWTTGCQTGGNYKDSWNEYIKFMNNVPKSFKGWYYLIGK